MERADVSTQEKVSPRAIKRDSMLRNQNQCSEDKFIYLFIFAVNSKSN
jgi:hypothetical protein